MSHRLVTTNRPAALTQQQEQVAIAGHGANRAAAGAVFADHVSRRADNTIRTQYRPLTSFAEHLVATGIADYTTEQLQRVPA